MFQKRFLQLISAAVLLLVTQACNNVNNSSTMDAGLYGSDVTGTTAFQTARTIMANQCFTCHGDWASFTETDFITTNRVVAGDPNGSSLYTNIRGNDSGIAGTMPLGKSDLTAEEIANIKSWISGM